VEISSDKEDDGSVSVTRKLPFDDVGDEGATGGCDLVVDNKKRNSCVVKEDDDCVVLDSDLNGTVPIGEEKGSTGLDVS
jgi:hypothetical protein